MANELTAEFSGTPLTIIDHAGRRWLTAEQVGLALGYEPVHARQGVNKLYARHRDEFTEADSCIIKLMTQGGDAQSDEFDEADTCGVNSTPQGQRRDIRVFSDTGCVMLGFFANTKRAKDFRSWAKRVLAVALPTAPAAPTSGPVIRITRALERDVLERFARGQSRKMIALTVGTSVVTVTLIVRGRYQFAPGAGAPQIDDALVAAVTRRHLLNEQARMVREQQRIANNYRSTAGNAQLAASLDTMGMHLQQRPALALAPVQPVADIAHTGEDA